MFTGASAIRIALHARRVLICDVIASTIMSTPGIAINRATFSSARAERARLRSMTARSSPRRSNSRRCRSMARRSSSGKACSLSQAIPLEPHRSTPGHGGIQTRMQDRLNACPSISYAGARSDRGW